jgi:hypothetical protein
LLLECRVLPKILFSIAALCGGGLAQEAGQQPQVKVNVLNVCSPSPEEQHEISAALSRVPRHPSFSADFEVDRGTAVLDQNMNVPGLEQNAVAPSGAAPTADFVRIRHDFAGNAPYSGVQYSFSRDARQMLETLVLRARDPKDVMQVSIEDSASAVTTPAAMLSAITPATRIRLERFGKSSIVLARCQGQNGGPPPDQSAYEPLFAAASSVLADYRALLGASRLVPEELARIGAKPSVKFRKPNGISK